MPHFIATYRYVDDAAGLDAQRATHRAYLASLEGLLLSGPTDVPGAALVFEAGSAEEVEAVLAADPFVTAGLVAESSVVAWTIVLGTARDRL